MTAQQIADWMYKEEALKGVAIAQAQAGEIVAAHDSFDKAIAAAQQIEKNSVGFLEEIAVAQAKAGFGEQALQTAGLILAGRDSQYPKIAQALADVDDKENFKGLLIPCGYYLNSAYRMCGLLARLYPEQATAVAAMANPRGSKT